MSFVDILPPPIQKIGGDVIVFTPTSLVKKVLDGYPPAAWNDKNLRWLNVFSKNGVFEYEVYCRLMVGLEEEIPVYNERREWIMENMIWSLCSETTCALVKRNFLGRVWGNLREWKDLPGNVYVADFLNDDIGEVMGKANGGEKKYVKFDCIVGNPPYQSNDGGARASAKALYPAFVEKAIECQPKYLSMVIPAKWMNGNGKGTTPFLKSMIDSKKIVSIVSTEDSQTWFPDIELPGGVMHFLYDSSKNDHIVNINGDKQDLSDAEVIITDTLGLQIKNKVLSKISTTFDTVMFGRSPFGLPTNFDDWTSSTHESKNERIPYGLDVNITVSNVDSISGNSEVYVCRVSGGEGKGSLIKYVAKHHVVKHVDSIPKWKVCLARGYGAEPKSTGFGFVAKPGEIITDSYLVMSCFDSEMEANNAAAFLQSRLAQFMVALLKGTQNMSPKTFRWVPVLDFSRSYTDVDLYSMFYLTCEEISHIEDFVKDFPMFRAAKAPKTSKPAAKKKSKLTPPPDTTAEDFDKLAIQ